MNQYKIIRSEDGFLVKKEEDTIIKMYHDYLDKSERSFTFYLGDKKVLVILATYTFFRRDLHLMFQDFDKDLKLKRRWNSHHLHVNEDVYKVVPRCIFNPIYKVLLNNKYYGKVYSRSNHEIVGTIEYEIYLREDGNEIYALLLFLLDLPEDAGDVLM